MPGTAKTKHSDLHVKTRPLNVLFVCKSNFGRSVMAEAMFNEYPKANISSSAGTDVSREGSEGSPTTPNFILVLAEIGLDASKHAARQLTEELANQADIIIYMANEKPPAFLKDSDKVRIWPVRDPGGLSVTDKRAIRDEIKHKVEELIKEIG